MPLPTRGAVDLAPLMDDYQGRAFEPTPVMGEATMTIHGTWVSYSGSFGLQFTAVRGRSRRTDHEHWSSLNRFGRARPELLMR